LTEELQVDFLRLGSSGVVGHRIRLTVELVGIDGTALWANSWRGGASTLLDLKSRLVIDVVEDLGIEYTREEIQVGTWRGTTNEDAYRQYLTGLDYLGQRTEVSSRLARRALEASVVADSGFADAHALLGQTYTIQRSLMPSADASEHGLLMDNSAEALRRDLSINPISSMAHLNFGYYQMVIGESEMAREAFEQVALLSPGDIAGPEAQRTIKIQSGDYPAALDFANEVVEREPNVYLHYQPRGIIYTEMMRFEEALETYQKMIDLEPDYPVPYLASVQISTFNLRDYQTSMKWYQNAATFTSLGSNASNRFELAEVYIHANEPNRVLALYDDGTSEGLPFRSLLAHENFTEIDSVAVFAQNRLASEPGFFGGWYALGYASERRGDTAAAKAYFDSSVVTLMSKINDNPGSATKSLDQVFLGLSLAKLG
jgi:tetratricopeptide (TPR) repeat protein